MGIARADLASARQVATHSDEPDAFALTAWLFVRIFRKDPKYTGRLERFKHHKPGGRRRAIL
ncbi:MAG TPA: hypothetical protein PKZ35_13755 [Gammaproteobacteria bacterium]|nr:hypothetical protein [Gammaproteobacteria bacterium]